MDAILGQYLAFDLVLNLAAILVFHLAEILAILWYFDLYLNHDQQYKWSFCLQDAILNHLYAALAVLEDTTTSNHLCATPTRDLSLHHL